MKPYIKSIVAGSLFLSLFATACKKEKEVDNDTGSASDNNLAESLFSEVKNITDAAATGTLGSTGYKASWDTTILGCATVIHDTTVSPRTLTIDYGTTNCLCGDGRNRRGKIIVSYTGAYKAVGTVITHTFDNFFINDNQILGTKTVTNMGLNTSGNIHFDINVSGSIVKAGGAGTVTWTSDRDREWIAGSGTPTLLDDVYLITGNGSGTRANGTNFTVTIVNPLRIELICPRIVSGTIDIVPAGKPTRTIDYGSGSCDNQATVTINGNVYNITL